MPQPSAASVIAKFVLLLAVVVGLSIFSAFLWSDKPETIPDPVPVKLSDGMTVERFGEANDLGRRQLREIFGLSSPDDLKRRVDEFQFAPDALEEKVHQAQAIGAEYESKNWFKIPVKFGLWFAFLWFVFRMLRKKAVSPIRRKGLYLAAVALFGVALTSDPSPMGTVKDTIHLFAAEGVFFMPRTIALCVFLSLVVLFNKSICAWGCQLGTLQDLIFRLGRNEKDSKAGAIRQVKLPFVFANSVRVAFFIIFTIAAFSWAVDIIEYADPFKVFKVQHLAIGGAAIIGLILVAALFVYRPWCTLFCPFGLVGWLFEKASLFRIKVDYDACIGCQACARACPSPVMEAILKRETMVIPDCFTCGTCMNVCPVDAISLARGKRDMPPSGHFERPLSEEGQSSGEGGQAGR